MCEPATYVRAEISRNCGRFLHANNILLENRAQMCDINHMPRNHAQRPVLSIWGCSKCLVPGAVNQKGEVSLPEPTEPPESILDNVLFGCRGAIKVWLGKGTRSVWSLMGVVG